MDTVSRRPSTFFSRSIFTLRIFHSDCQLGACDSVRKVQRITSDNCARCLLGNGFVTTIGRSEKKRARTSGSKRVSLYSFEQKTPKLIHFETTGYLTEESDLGNSVRWSPRGDTTATRFKLRQRKDSIPVRLVKCDTCIRRGSNPRTKQRGRLYTVVYGVRTSK